jgi:acyl-CoA-binding protein
MKALKKNSTLYLEQIASAVAECYERDEKPCNRVLLELYTLIGQCVCRQGEKAFIPHLAGMLTNRFPSLKGFSLRNLRRMRDFYRTYENAPALMGRGAVPWLDAKFCYTGVLRNR